MVLLCKTRRRCCIRRATTKSQASFLKQLGADALFGSIIYSVPAGPSDELVDTLAAERL
jgi:hypothetical protein